MNNSPLAQIKRSPLQHDLTFTLLCGTIDPGSSLRLLRNDQEMLTMIVDHVLPEWRRQAEKISLLGAAKEGLMPELRTKLHLTAVDVNSEKDWLG